MKLRISMICEIFPNENVRIILIRNFTRRHVNYFVDDTMLFSIVNDPVTSANDLNHDLKS